MPTVLTVADVKKILRAPDLSTHIGTRDRAVLELLWSSALRETELCNLDLANLNFNSNLIKVNLGKGRNNAKDGTAPKLPRWASSGERMTADALYNLVKKYAEKAKVKKNVYPHIFRATAATEMLRKGANPYLIQVYLGHSSMSSIDSYLAITAQDLVKGFRRYHPRSMDERGTNKVENIVKTEVFGDESA
jgi:integrase/recombinase XerD